MVAEIRYGIERLPPGRRRQQVVRAAEDVLGRCCSTRAALVTRNLSDFTHAEVQLINPGEQATHE